MDEKEMREAFTEAASKDEVGFLLGMSGLLYNSARTQCAWQGFQMACAWMMGKAEPFMYAISYEGKAYFDENCVSPDAESLEYEVDNLNDANDAGYSIVPLFTAPPMQNTEREIVLPEFKGAIFKNKEGLNDREILKKVLEDYARAAVELDRKGRS